MRFLLWPLAFILFGATGDIAAFWCAKIMPEAGGSYPEIEGALEELRPVRCGALLVKLSVGWERWAQEWY